jgi:hypothetical protein
MRARSRQVPLVLAVATAALCRLGNVLGANAWGVALAVGDGSTFPHCMRHRRE